VSNNGHYLEDEWTFNVHGGLDHDGNSKAWGYFMTHGAINQDTVLDEEIAIGANITLVYDEYKNETHFWEINHISNGRYDNIQEWYHKEDIFEKIEAQFGGISKLDINFFRGYLDDMSGRKLPYQNTTGGIIMMIKSKGTQNNDFEKQARVRATTTISQTQTGETNFILLLETEGKD